MSPSAKSLNINEIARGKVLELFLIYFCEKNKLKTNEK